MHMKNMFYNHGIIEYASSQTCKSGLCVQY